MIKMSVDTKDITKLAKSLEPSRVNEALKAVGKEVEKVLIQRYQDTVKGWSVPPQFYSRSGIGKGIFVAEISTDSVIYSYVDEGTRPHVIMPAYGRLIRFDPRLRGGGFRVIAPFGRRRPGQVISPTGAIESAKMTFLVKGWAPKTAPGTGVFSGGKEGSEFRSRKKINHPGGKPRGYSDKILIILDATLPGIILDVAEGLVKEEKAFAKTRAALAGVAASQAARLEAIEALYKAR